MAYVAVTGGQEAIRQADRLSRYYRLKEAEPLLATEAIHSQMRSLVDRVMGEAGLYEPRLAALALKQAEGDPGEAVFLLRAYRSTLQRNHYSRCLEADAMRPLRRISSSFRDLPGGQLLGPTRDYTHRLLDFSLHGEREDDREAFMREFVPDPEPDEERQTEVAKAVELLKRQRLVKPADRDTEAEPFDVTRQKLTFPAPRSAKLQTLARGETGAMNALAYSSLRGYGIVHPTLAELRVGYVPVLIDDPYGDGAEDDPFYVGEMLVTETEAINEMKKDKRSGEPYLEMGYGLVVGQNELKAIAMAVLERSLDTEGSSPAQDEEFVLTHIDCVEAAGYVSHLKLPHYVSFQSSLDRLQKAAERGNDSVGKGEEPNDDGQQ